LDKAAKSTRLAQQLIQYRAASQSRLSLRQVPMTKCLSGQITLAQSVL
jgi:hypothetical protein